MKIRTAFRQFLILISSFIYAWSISAQACNKNTPAEKIATETFNISELKIGNSKIITWGYLPVAIIKKPQSFTPSQTNTMAQEFRSCRTESFEAFIGENGAVIENPNAAEVSVLILLSPIGCSPTIFMSPSSTLSPKENNLIKSLGGIIYDTCSGAVFDLNGTAINSESVKSSNMLSPAHKINSDGTLTLGVTAN